MTEEERVALAELIHDRREALGLAAREVGRRAGVDYGTVIRLEQGRIALPRADTLSALSGALGIPLADIYTAINWLPSGALPGLRPYMRAKYDNLPESAVTEVEQFIEQLSQQHKRGPLAGEDELPDQ